MLFATSGGSGFGNTVNELKDSCNAAMIHESKIINALDIDAQIREIFDSHKVVLKEKYEMSLEVAVDGMIDLTNVAKMCMDTWENINIKLLDLNDYSDRELMTEVIEDGIQL